MNVYEIIITDWGAGTWTIPSGWSANKSSDDLIVTHGLGAKPIGYTVFHLPSDYPTSPGVWRAETSITTLFINSDNAVQIRKLGLLDGNTIHANLFFEATT